MESEEKRISANMAGCCECGAEFATEEECRKHRTDTGHNDGFKLGRLELSWAQLNKISQLSAGIIEVLNEEANSPMVGLLVLEVARAEIILNCNTHARVAVMNVADVIGQAMARTAKAGQA